MLRRKCWLMFAFAALALVGLASEAAAAEKIKVLLMGGRGHDWKGFHGVISEVLDKTGDFDVVLSADLEELKPESIG